MMIYKEQWPIVTQNKRSLQKILMTKMELKQKDVKSMAAFGIGERNKRGDHLTEFAEEHKLNIANTLFQKQKTKTKKLKTQTKQILDFGVTRKRNKKSKRSCIE